jgi:hypothetical protein
VYSEAVRRGGTLVSVRASDAQAPQAREMLQRFQPIDPVTRGQAYRKQGWSGRFDPKHQPIDRAKARSNACAEIGGVAPPTALCRKKLAADYGSELLSAATWFQDRIASARPAEAQVRARGN